MGSCRWPEGCCNSHDECSDGMYCHEGVCRVTPPGEPCWLDLHCKVGEVCEGVGFSAQDAELVFGWLDYDRSGYVTLNEIDQDGDLPPASPGEPPLNWD